MSSHHHWESWFCLASRRHMHEVIVRHAGLKTPDYLADVFCTPVCVCVCVWRSCQCVMPPPHPLWLTVLLVWCTHYPASQKFMYWYRACMSVCVSVCESMCLHPVKKVVEQLTQTDSVSWEKKKGKKSKVSSTGVELDLTNETSLFFFSRNLTRKRL